MSEKSTRDLLLEALHGQHIKVSLGGPIHFPAVVHVNAQSQTICFELECGIRITGVLHKRIALINTRGHTTKIEIDLV